MSRFIDYFAYGSNLSYARLAARIGGCAVLGTAELRGFRLEFHKRGADGSAKCNAHRTDHHADSVLGVIYVISETQKSVLDRYEGVGFGYEVHDVEATLHGSAGARNATASRRGAVVYLADPAYVGDDVVPYSWYRDFVSVGARSHGLPDHYVSMIERVPAATDPDVERHRHNARILSTPLEELPGASR